MSIASLCFCEDLFVHFTKVSFPSFSVLRSDRFTRIIAVYSWGVSFFSRDFKFVWLGRELARRVSLTNEDGSGVSPRNAALTYYIYSSSPYPA